MVVTFINEDQYLQTFPKWLFELHRWIPTRSKNGSKTGRVGFEDGIIKKNYCGIMETDRIMKEIEIEI
jgi:hypothetical protein